MTASDSGSTQERPGQAAGDSFTTGTPAGTGQDAPGASVGGPGGTTGRRISGGVNRTIAATMSGPGPAGRRRGRSRIFWYLRMALWLIGLGLLIYVFVFRHSSFTNCNTNCDPG